MVLTQDMAMQDTKQGTKKNHRAEFGDLRGDSYLPNMEGFKCHCAAIATTATTTHHTVTLSHHNVVTYPRPVENNVQHGVSPRYTRYPMAN